jgi:hypothetical protein
MELIKAPKLEFLGVSLLDLLWRETITFTRILEPSDRVVA